MSEKSISLKKIKEYTEETIKTNKKKIETYS